MKNTVFLMILILSCLLFAEDIDENRNLLNSTNNFDLIKYYLVIEDYEQAISIIDSSLVDSVMTDSLNYFKGIAFLGLKRYTNAADSFAETIFSNPVISSQDRSLKYFQDCLSKLHITDAIEKTTVLLDSIRNNDIRNDLMLTIAEIYEDNQVFSEAIDVYLEILSDNDISDEVFLHYKIARNKIFLKNYTEALQILDDILASEDTLHRENTLLLSYVANYSAGNIPKAKENLMQLYDQYPDSENRFGFTYNLADIFQQERQYLLSWFLLNELYKSGSEAQKFVIYSKIEKIKELLIQDSLTVDQFKNFKPDFGKISE